MLHLQNVKIHFFHIKLGSFKYISYICTQSGKAPLLQMLSRASVILDLKILVTIY